MVDYVINIKTFKVLVKKINLKDGPDSSNLSDLTTYQYYEYEIKNVFNNTLMYSFCFDIITLQLYTSINYNKNSIYTGYITFLLNVFQLQIIKVN